MDVFVWKCMENSQCEHMIRCMYVKVMGYVKGLCEIFIAQPTLFGDVHECIPYYPCF